MRILHCVEFYYPSVGGAQEVVRQISERLVQQGHQVTVATSTNANRTDYVHHGVSIVEFSVSGNQANGLHGEVERYQEFVRNGSFDVIMIYAAQQWTLDSLIPVLPSISTPLVLVPCGFSGLNNPAYQKYFLSMPSWLIYFRKLVFLSESYQDIKFVREHGYMNTVLIPNGADEHEFNDPPQDFRKKYGLNDEFLLLTVGGHTGIKGHAFAMRAFTKARIKDATLLIIGNTPVGGGCKRNCTILANVYNFHPRNMLKHKRIVILDPPRHDVVSAFSMSNLFILPSNIEASPLVLYESMAAKLPFISFDVGNTREIVDWSNGGIIAKTRKRADGFAFGDLADCTRLIELLYRDPDGRRQLGLSGHAAWERSFTFERLASKYEQLYHEILAT
ncbi:MAG: glycosyltransferase family 4 protein [Patescibacteria group bacterium]